jgi:hypothetical protein
MNTPHRELDLRQLLTLNDVDLETAIRRRVAMVNAQVEPERQVKLKYLKNFQDLTAENTNLEPWGTILRLL